MSGELNSEATDKFLVGFVTVVEQAGDYQGGYLCVDQLGAPVECRYTLATKPSRVQTLLYGQALEPLLRGRSIAGTLLENLEHKPTIVLTDQEAVLKGLGAREFPVAEVVADSSGGLDGNTDYAIDTPRGHVRLKSQIDGSARFGTAIEQLRGFDVLELFERIKSILPEISKAAAPKSDE
jgi:hypothetical protein